MTPQLNKIPLSPFDRIYPGENVNIYMYGKCPSKKSHLCRKKLQFSQKTPFLSKKPFYLEIGDFFRILKHNKDFNV